MAINRLPPFWDICVAGLLSVAAQFARIPLDPPTLMPYITYVPFILLSAFLGGLAPGLLATGLCVLESVFFATPPLGSFGVADRQALFGAAVLAFTGIIAPALFERVRRAEARLADVNAELTT